ncbi:MULTISPECIES: MarR family winged helix-turn-helix transcriptional regulator [Nocardiaceae]|uniref:MarR family winged helix-turn-helix transcriptional regulator n=1 Tax=Nocardiaceae TaxID=85025 RepID=UPI00050CD1B3|nr:MULTISPECIES: MarR family transcriptional regulator [Rhodococcus]MDJ0408470.1 MarR family transcriptional regulator [Rhodococcus fascians]GHP17050.1 MarR family transcriptional regulator [Rhodococcus sp. NKCM2511]
MASRPSSAGEQPTLLYAIKQVELAVRAQMDALLRPINITAVQYTALTVLRRRDGLSSAELARNSFVTAQTMGEMIAALEKRGLVTRRTDPANKRRMLTSLTEEARRLLAEYDAQIGDLEDRMVADLSPRQRDEFRGFLRSCRLALGHTGAH